MRDLDMPQSWKEEVEKAADFDIHAYVSAVARLSRDNTGHYGEEYILKNYDILAAAHNSMTLYMINLHERRERRGNFSQAAE
jgi:hypothetical protein